MSSCISAIGIANPDHRVSQKNIYRFMVNAFGLDERDARRLKQIYDQSAIDYRYSVIPDFACERPEQYTFFSANAGLEPFADTQKRLEKYRTEGIKIGLRAAIQCLEYVDRKDITHLITVSCTGMHAPGIDIQLVEELGLNYHTERTCINFMGCYGAVNALKLADYICRSEPKAKVLIVSVELCTLHFQKKNTLDNWVANSLFSDGAAAMLVENTAVMKKGASCLELKEFYSEFIPEAAADMQWNIGNTGFEMALTSKVPKYIGKYISSLTEKLLQKTGPNQTIDHYAIHPGGRKILEAAGEALHLPDGANDFAYEILRQYGNMSSATIIFVLHKFLYATDLKSGRILSFAFGPGLTVETMLLKRT